jgi:hypothetical protein
MVYYLTIKGTDETWKHVKGKKPITKGHTFSFYEMSRIDKSTETENRLVAAKDWGNEKCSKIRQWW